MLPIFLSNTAVIRHIYLTMRRLKHSLMNYSAALQAVRTEWVGDASAEEDYVLGALGWASTKNLPMIFVVEDNNLSILTEKKMRRNWELPDVAKGFKMKGFDTSDDPMELASFLKNPFSDGPTLLNVNTHRKYWHSGAGIDDEDIFDRYQVEMDDLGEEAIEIDKKTKQKVEEIWHKQLETQ